MISNSTSLRRNLSLALLLALPAFTHAATHTVTSLADDGSAGTLRALCASAADGDEIVFGASLAGGTIEITTASGPIEIGTTLSIAGPEKRLLLSTASRSHSIGPPARLTSCLSLLLESTSFPARTSRSVKAAMRISLAL